MTAEKNIKVLLVDDHAMVRGGIKMFLKYYDGMELLGEAQDGEEALRFCENQRPDVILMDLMMPNMDGITATRMIKDKWPEIKIIALTSFDQKELVSGALKAGASGYLLKNSSAEELAEAIRMANNGQSVLSTRATQSLVSDSLPIAETKTFNLTEKEMEILSLMVQGATNKEISEKLVLGVSTIKFHVSNILSKLGVETRTEAATIAMKNNII
jgi:NarL family two-component system response regulator LiaR